MYWKGHINCRGPFLHVPCVLCSERLCHRDIFLKQWHGSIEKQSIAKASFTPNSFAIRPYTFQHKLQNGLKRAILIKCFVWYDTSTFLNSFQYVDCVFIQSAVRWYPVQIGSSHQFTSLGRRFQTAQVRLQCVGTRSDPVVPRSHYVQFRSN